MDTLLLSLLEIARPGEWESWLGSARKFFGAAAATLVPLPSAPGSWLSGISVGVSKETEQAYQEHYHSVDTWTHRLRASPPGRAYTLEMLVPERELLHSEIYNDFMAPAGRRYVLGTTIQIERVRFLLAFSRLKTQEDFDEDLIRALERLSAYLRPVLAAHTNRRALEAQLSAALELANQYPYGVLLVDADQRVMFFNRTAGEFLGSEDSLLIRNSRITAASSGDAMVLAGALQAVSAKPGAHRALTITGVRTGERVVASVIGVIGHDGSFLDQVADAPAAVILLSRKGGGNDVQPVHLESLLGFTPQEAQTASLLVAGQDVNQIAAQLSIGRETVRYFLKCLFAKTGTHSQRELVEFIGSSVPRTKLTGPHGNTPGSNGAR